VYLLQFLSIYFSPIPSLILPSLGLGQKRLLALSRAVTFAIALFVATGSAVQTCAACARGVKLGYLRLAKVNQGAALFNPNVTSARHRCQCFH
jgi:hypothetical protein